MKTLAIIPARGGSKSIPRKNLKKLGSKPLIAYPIQLAKSIAQIDRVIVSTEDQEIANTARQYGAEVPFLRPQELATDETPTLPVLQHCVQYLEESEKFTPDIILTLYPTCPFLQPHHIVTALSHFSDEKCNSVISVTEDFGRYWKLNKQTSQYEILYPKERINRQYYKPLYKENGGIYYSRYDTIMKQNKIVDDSAVRFVVMEEGELVDLDTPHDWKKAEEKL